MKKLLCLALAAMLCLALAACAVAEGNWKIAILTGTTSQGEEEFRAAERAQKADPEHIITDTYPDKRLARHILRHHHRLEFLRCGIVIEFDLQAHRVCVRSGRQGHRDVSGCSGREGRV